MVVPVILPCPLCTRPIDLVTPKSGEKFRCPHCQKVFTYGTPAPQPTTTTPVTTTGAPPQAKPLDRAAAAGYPPADGPEVNILVLRPPMARGRPFAFAGLWLTVVAGLIGAAVLSVTSLSMAWLPCLAGAGLAGAALGVWKVRSLGQEIRVTSKRLIDRDGYFNRRTSEVLHRDIRNITIKQTFWERIWGVGELAISTSADQGPEVYMAKVPRPNQVREVIDLYRSL